MQEISGYFQVIDNPFRCVIEHTIQLISFVSLYVAIVALISALIPQANEMALRNQSTNPSFAVYYNYGS